MVWQLVGCSVEAMAAHLGLSMGREKGGLKAGLKARQTVPWSVGMME
jgi:hypothetical protein